VLQLNPYHPYPFKPALVNGKPVTTSQEMAIGYRFHEILPTDVPLINENGEVTSNYNIVNTSFDAEGFLKVGLDAVLRGMASIKIPRFHTGTSDIYRNMRFNFGDPEEHTGFDLVAWTIYHERERGLPTFNQVSPIKWLVILLTIVYSTSLIILVFLKSLFAKSSRTLHLTQSIWMLSSVYMPILTQLVRCLSRLYVNT